MRMCMFATSTAAAVVFRRNLSSDWLQNRIAGVAAAIEINIVELVDQTGCRNGRLILGLISIAIRVDGFVGANFGHNELFVCHHLCMHV